MRVLLGGVLLRVLLGVLLDSVMVGLVVVATEYVGVKLLWLCCVCVHREQIQVHRG